MQARKHSLIESIAGTAIGFAVSVLLTSLIFPGMGALENFRVTLIFTAASIVRSYYVRRFFNWLNMRAK